MAKVQFGKSGCSTIEVDPFTPICSYTEPDGTKPLSLNVPVPTFVPPVPPNECACFTFTSTETETEFTPDCTTGKATLSVEIKQADPEDCCSGNYVVVPAFSLNMPCMPFSVSDAEIAVYSRKTSPAGIAKDESKDGGIKFSLTQDCCQLVPHIDLVVPDCIKKYDNLGYGSQSQLKCCDKGVEKGYDLIEMKTDTDTCSVYPIIHPVSIPCCTLEDRPASNPLSEGSVKLDGRSDEKAGWLNWKLTREDCNVALSLTSTPGDCFCPEFTSTTSEVNFTENKTKYGTVSVAIVNEGTCCEPVYKITPTLNIPSCTFADDEAVSTGYKELSNVGGKITWTLKRNDCAYSLDIVVDPIDIETKIAGLMCVPGVDVSTAKYNIKYYDDDATTADHTTTKEVENPVSITRAEKAGVADDCQDYLIGVKDLDLSFIKPRGFSNGGDIFKASDNNLYIDGDEKNDKTWYGGGIGNMSADQVNRVDCRGPTMRGADTPYGSGDVMIPFISPATRMIDDNTQSAVKWASMRASGSGDNIERSGASGYVSGNLSMNMPTGFQWDKRGIALTLNTFKYNSSGVLSWVEESGTAALLAPGLAMHGTAHGSGLAVYPDGDYAKLSSGLYVNAGRGLRIHGTANTKTTVEAYTNQVEVYKDDDDFAFEGNKLAINDKRAGTYNFGINDNSSGVTSFARNYEYTIPVVMADWGQEAQWVEAGNGYRAVTSTINGYINDFNDKDADTSAKLNALKGCIADVMAPLLASLFCVNVHISKAGVVLGANIYGTGKDLTRRIGDSVSTADA